VLEPKVVTLAHAAVDEAVTAEGGLRERLAKLGAEEPVPESRETRWADQLVRDAGDRLRKDALLLEDEEAEGG